MEVSCGGGYASFYFNHNKNVFILNSDFNININRNQAHLVPIRLTEHSLLVDAAVCLTVL